ncbi:MAG: hypothetical protein ACI381_05520 [Candidatus Methanomethylophilaceae archaeon]
MSIKQEAILKVLRDNGPLTAREISDKLRDKGLTGKAELDPHKIGWTLRTMEKWYLVREVDTVEGLRGVDVPRWEVVE